MSTEREFREKWQSRIDGCGPYCSCLVTLGHQALAPLPQHLENPLQLLPE